MNSASQRGTGVNQDPEKKWLFGPVALRLFRFTAVLFALVTLGALVSVIVWSLASVLSIFSHLLLPLSVAGILALVLNPVMDFLHERLRMPRILATVLLLAGFALGVGGLIFLLVPTMIEQGRELADIIAEAATRWQERLDRYFPGWVGMVSGHLENVEFGHMLPTLGDTREAIMSYIALLVGFTFVPLFLFFALLSGEKLRGKVSEVFSVLDKRTQMRLMYFLDVFIGYITAFFRGQLLIAMIMGALYAVGFTLIGLQAGIILGLLLGLLNIIPFLGTLIGLLLVLPMAYFQAGGGIELFLLTLVVFAVVQLVESWLLTPKIMADRSGLHPALVVVALFFWATLLGGIIGMILAVPLTAFFIAIWGEIKEHVRHTLDTDKQGEA